MIIENTIRILSMNWAALISRKSYIVRERSFVIHCTVPGILWNTKLVMIREQQPKWRVIKLSQRKNKTTQESTPTEESYYRDIHTRRRKLTRCVYFFFFVSSEVTTWRCRQKPSFHERDVHRNWSVIRTLTHLTLGEKVRLMTKWTRGHRGDLIRVLETA